jgi:hypothetical protein
MSFQHSIVVLGLVSIVALGCGRTGGGGGASTVAVPGLSVAPVSTSPGVGAFVTVTPLAQPRVFHTATLLPSGRVLFAGGQTSAQTVTSSTELFDPASGQVSAGPPLAFARRHHAALALPSGEVLVVGGESDAGGASPLDSTELYDPVANAWRVGPRLSVARSEPALALFRDPSGSARVLVAGGASFVNGLRTSLSSADVYFVDQKTIAPSPASLAQDRTGAAATTLASGQVLVAGGTTQLGLAGPARPASSELYDPFQQRFLSVATPAPWLDGALVAAGAVYAIGGSDGTQPLASVSVFNGGSWSRLAPLARARESFAAAPVRVGSGALEVLVAGGEDASGVLASAELVGPAAGTPPALHVARAHATATALASGEVVLAGGHDGSSILSSLEVYSPTSASVPGATANLGATAPASLSGTSVSSVNVTALNPGWGNAGAPVTISGTGFDPNPANDVVTFNGVPAVVASANVANPLAETLSVVVPAGATSGPVVVTVLGQASPQAPLFTVGTPGASVPTILAAVPSAGPVFMPVSITGQNFGSSPVVSFGGIPTASIVSLSTKTLPLVGQVSELVVLVPPGASSGPLVVSNGSFTSSPVSFTVQ